ncbi:hypothetical protein M0R45_009795 [Rubus argutus]|uniref:Uncharacterized protein n=1 Tax=Rubus argutus TaxID=59490 RepID=A0AAW1Y5T2_RUBAR
MEEVKSSAEGKQSRRASLKRALLQHFRTIRIHQTNKIRKKLLTKSATIARVNGINVISRSTQEDNGMMKMKFLVREEDLEQVLEFMRNNNDNNNNNNNNNNINKNNNENDADDYEEVSESLSVEERLNLLKKKLKRQNTWSPALQTIPEEILT